LRHLKNAKRGGAVKEAPDTDLDVFPLSLVGFRESPLLCDLQLGEALREHLPEYSGPPLL
jgi:hypothetical protein